MKAKIKTLRWSHCASTATKWATVAGILFFLFFSIGHSIENSRPDWSFVLLMLLSSVSLIACLIPPLTLVWRGIRVFCREARTWDGILYATCGLLLSVPLFFLWRMINAFFWDWLDIPIF